MAETVFHSGFVTVIGRPNVGKSTLINRIVGEKVSIVSPKPQTTRNRIVGILNGEGHQIVFLDTPGLHEIHPDGIFEVNPLFKNFEKDGLVTGYGISSPGRLYQKFLAGRNGKLAPEVRDQMMTATALGFYTSLVLEGAEESLRKGQEIADGVTRGITVDLKALLARELGQGALAEYGY